MSTLFNAKNRKIWITAGILLGGLVVLSLVKRKKIKKRRKISVAEEGYETAEDILFPKRKYARFGN